ncbi:3-isopropylmalate dehydratase small subunit [Paraferrimonas sp. SM1919]|uniref:3-isopropylmalate dehydratase small subunit n=1 Tax=Paraferrimonas sp. SM1919 TaxID=2662263 RepID=UPI0013D4C5E5|nr:3-isopropylmalate dehydratase small subunit [Paraferrimonas sp. SM1919]
MQPFIKHQGVTATLLHANIDTDQIIPKQFLSKVDREGFGVHLFHDWRYLDEAGEQPNPEFALNQPEVKGASILLAGENFGCGSSREHAPWALNDFGFKAIIAPSFADIFYNNSINIGMVPVKLSIEDINAIAAEVAADPQAQQVIVDLEAMTVTSPSGKQYSFPLAQEARHNLLNGLDAIGLTLENREAIDAYEASIPAWRGAPQG